MHPNAYQGSGTIHECANCGARVDAPTSTVCGVCQGTLLNISRARDC
jgi:hypothetical protein